jgi:putative lipoic acid-binding regulatory protein
MEDQAPSCSGPFGGATINYPVQFDLRIIYLKAEVPADLDARLSALLASLQVPCTLIQGIAKPEGRYGRMGARIRVESAQIMQKLYASVAAIPGVKAVI